MSNEQKVKSFMEKYDVKEDVARQYLNSNDWVLDSALSRYAADSERPGAEDAGTSGKNNTKLNDEPSKKIVTLESLRNDDPKKDDNESEFYYSAGSGSTGQQILGAPKHVHMSDSTPALTTISSDRSWGKGVRLGDANTVVPINDTEEQDRAASADDVTYIVLHLWRDGYSIDDGELRSTAIPQNIDFLEAILRDEFPPELGSYGKKVDVTVDDRSGETFRHLNRSTFYGSGHLLGSPTPPIETDQQPTENELEQNEILARQNLKFDEKKPSTVMHIRLADGTRLTGQFNMNHTIGHVYRYIRDARPEYAEVEFILMTTYPRQELIDEQLTLTKAKLKNVVLVQSIITKSE